MIETKRLYIIPLTVNQVKYWTQNTKKLEEELSITYDYKDSDREIIEIASSQIGIIKLNKKNYLFYTFWLIIKKDDRKAIGSICFKGMPDGDNQVEIGYGLGKEYEGNGYMTETVIGFTNWALDKNITVIAETEKNNLRSQNVLKRCGFKLYREDDSFWWKLQKVK